MGAPTLGVPTGGIVIAVQAVSASPSRNCEGAGASYPSSCCCRFAGQWCRRAMPPMADGTSAPDQGLDAPDDEDGRNKRAAGRGIPGGRLSAMISWPTRATAMASPLRDYTGWYISANCPACRILGTVAADELLQ